MKVEAHGHVGWMRWALVGVDAITTVAERAGFTVTTTSSDGSDRHVAELQPV
jgi:hypothetical protein